MAECLFCSIAAGDIPADIVLSTDTVVAFRDIEPQAPTHVLVIPKAHYENIGALSAEDPALAGGLADAARQVADADGIGDAYRLVFNTERGPGSRCSMSTDTSSADETHLAARMTTPASDAHAHTTIEIPGSQPMVALLGPGDEYLRLIEGAFPDVDILVRGNEMTLDGSAEEVGTIDSLVAEMLAMLRTGQALTTESVERSISMMRSGTRPTEVLTANILSNRGRTIRPKTLNQKRYVDAIDNNTVVFGIGPAGTGKTYLAVAKAVQALQAKQITRIVLTRPAVEAGERLGFLPGTLSEKIDPYLRPLYDALHDMIDPESIPRLITTGTIEIAPLAYMRGRTLNDAFVILDEAQNTSAEQMKMFLTRLGFGSTMVVTGDITQVDLPGGTQSGLRVVSEILEGIDDVAFCRLTSHDVVRHKLVGRIVEAYDRYDAKKQTMTLPSITVDDETGSSLDLTALSDLAGHVLVQMHVDPTSELGITLVDPERMTTLHEDWSEPGPTDVLSFPIDELTPGTASQPTGPGVLGDIVICPEHAQADAQEADRTLEEHVHFLTVHGLLHLLGYDHASEEDYAQMFTRQDELLESWETTK